MTVADMTPPQAADAADLDVGPARNRIATAALCEALLESRERWRDLAAMTADFVFETDGAGSLVFVAPSVVLGWPAAMLLGQSASLLLAGPPGGFDPFHPVATVRDRRCWLKRADGGLACFTFACAPLETAAGQAVGSRGAAHDVTQQDLKEATVAGALRRGEVIEHILWQMRQEVLAPRMMQAVLEELVAAMGAKGASVVDLLAPADDGAVLHESGAGIAPVLPAVIAMLQAESLDPVSGVGPAGHPLLGCPSYTRFGERAGLALWRAPGAELWSDEDRLLASAAATIMRVVLEHEAIQRELARQARTDPLTGLLNRRSFLADIHRRIDRLDCEGSPGTLMYVDLDHFKELNDSYGHDVGDEALVLTANLLRLTVRPADLVSRLGGDEFAVWLDGSDELTAAERAERLRLETPGLYARDLPQMSRPLSMSIGIASRHAGGGETLDNLMRRADAAMYEVKRSGRGHWRVARDEFLP